MEKEVIVNNIAVNAIILTGGMWPAQQEITVKIPSCLQPLQIDFEHFYKSKF